jgi:hypothetical protein
MSTDVKYYNERFFQITPTARKPLDMVPCTTQATLEIDIHEKLTKRVEEGSVLDMKFPVKPVKKMRDEYPAAMEALEESIADVVIEDPQVCAFLDTACRRVDAIIAAYAKVTSSNGSVLEKELRSFRVYNDLYVDLETKYQAYGGMVGSNPLAIKHALLEGNFREKAVALLCAKKTLLTKISEDPDLLRRVNAELAKQEQDWKLLEDYPLSPDGAYCAPTFNKKRKPEVVKAELAQYPYLNQLQMRIPLSEREKRVATNDLMYTNKQLERTRIQWPAGSLYIDKITIEDANHPYLQAANDVKAPLIASISGSTDQICAALCFMGLNSKKDLLLGRLVCCGWLINDKSHSAAEVLTSARSFDLPFIFSSDYYKSLLPSEMGGDELIQKIAEKQHARGYRLPDAYEVSIEKICNLVEQGSFFSPEKN